MKDLMSYHGLQKPKFEERGNFFRLTFYGPGNKILDLIKPEGEIDLKELGLNERQIEALKLMVNEDRVLSNKQYRTTFNVSRNTASNDLAQLVRENLAKKEGAGKGTKYEAA